MNRARDAPHADALEVAVPHFNAAFRERYRLPSVTIEALREVSELDELLGDLPSVRANGVVDASCALIARLVLSIVPRYAIGLVHGQGRVTVLGPDEGDDESYLTGHALLVNPLGGPNNWTSIARWFRKYASENARRAQLAGLASEDRPDEAANFELLRQAASTHGRAIMLPPDEAFSAARAAEVSYIYGVPVETLRAWKQRHRDELAAKKPGAPRKNR